MTRINEDRFKKLLVESSFESDDGTVVRLSEVFRIFQSLECKHDECPNEARYDSGYCSIHDMQLNNGKGKRVTLPEPS